MKNNMERLVKELQERFGEEYEVVSVKVPKNNEVLDGFQISRKSTGFGITFYPDFEREPDNYADFWEPIIKKYFKKGLPVDLGEILKPGFILSHLQMRLVSISRNEELLKQYKNVIVPELDLAILFNVNLNEEIDMLIPTKYKGLDVSDKTIVTDVTMAASGIRKGALERLGLEVKCYLADPRVAEMASRMNITRTQAGIRLATEEHPDALYVFGNAPTALMELCSLMRRGKACPVGVVGAPVGFVNVRESKHMLKSFTAVPKIIIEGRKGGSNLAATIVNAILCFDDAGQLLPGRDL